VSVTFAPVWREVPSRVAEEARVCCTSADMRGGESSKGEVPSAK